MILWKKALLRVEVTRLLSWASRVLLSLHREIEGRFGSIHSNETLQYIGFVANAFRQSGMEDSEEERLRYVRIISQCGECERDTYMARRALLLSYSAV